ncbi:MAG TPA: MFS transporter [Nevskia sp.]|nr:MFS transporter [Nevskia sp.]
MRASLAGKLGRLHYSWVVMAVIFLCLLAAAGVRATPGVLIVPWQQSLGWDRAVISLAIAINVFLYGLMGPFAAACMQRFGIRRTVLSALALLAVVVAASTRMSATWQLMLGWGVLVGTGSGFIAVVLAAAVVNRWFSQRRGLVMGILTASTATGQLVFLPLLAAVVEHGGWRPVALIVSGVAAAVALLALLLLPESPREVGQRPYGAAPGEEPPAEPQVNPLLRALRVLGQAVRVRDFWLLFFSFFVCGLSSSGLIGTHLISACIDAGLPATSGARLLAMMGVFDLIGTTASGWLSDRYDNRLLLFFYYGLRGLALLYLPYSGYAPLGLFLFAVFYGLDWIATVPPTVRLTNQVFGVQDAPVVFGWVVAGHQLGAAVAAYGAGLLRETLGSYTSAYFTAGAFCVIAALMVTSIARRGQVAEPQPA